MSEDVRVGRVEWNQRGGWSRREARIACCWHGQYDCWVVADEVALRPVTLLADVHERRGSEPDRGEGRGVVLGCLDDALDGVEGRDEMPFAAAPIVQTEEGCGHPRRRELVLALVLAKVHDSVASPHAVLELGEVRHLPGDSLVWRDGRAQCTSRESVVHVDDVAHRKGPESCRVTGGGEQNARVAVESVPETLDLAVPLRRIRH